LKNKIENVASLAVEITQIKDKLAEFVPMREEAEQMRISETISEIRVEISSKDREIEFLKTENNRLNERLNMLKHSIKPGTPVNQESRSKQMYELDELFIEYSKVWRNICFVEHHLKRLDEAVFAPAMVIGPSSPTMEDISETDEIIIRDL
jgi:chromosome segregation ATPase